MADLLDRLGLTPRRPVKGTLCQYQSIFAICFSRWAKSEIRLSESVGKTTLTHSGVERRERCIIHTEEPPRLC